MLLIDALKYNGYTGNDLRDKVRKFNIDPKDFAHALHAHRPDGRSHWKYILDALDDMGVNW